ncbi:MAG: hypothetical protein AB8F95_20475 [Bacteroidia bacterium]
MKNLIAIAVMSLVVFWLGGSSFGVHKTTEIKVPDNCGIAALIPPAWKTDEYGCKGDRQGLSRLMDSLDFAGYSRACIYYALGPPNYVSDDSTYIEYYLYDSCDVNFWGDRSWASLGFENEICDGIVIFTE